MSNTNYGNPTVATRIETDKIEKLDKLANELGTNRAGALRHCIDCCLGGEQQ